MPKQLLFDEEGRRALKRGVDKAVEAMTEQALLVHLTREAS